MTRLFLKWLMLLAVLACITLSMAGCYATYEREEYYESGQLKSKEYSRAWSVKAR